MTDILIAVSAIATVVLGVLAYTKLRRAIGSTPERDKRDVRKVSQLPRELRELQIEQPTQNTLDHLEEPTRNS
jgi:hypothetical protein